MDKSIDYDFLIEIVATYISDKSKPEQREAAYLLMCFHLGNKWTKSFVKDIAKDYGIESRSDYKVEKWSKEIRKKYNNKCANCGSNKKTHAHHIWGWSRHPRHRVDINNGILLCVNCHALEHPEITKLIKSRGDSNAAKM